ncbi:MAG: HEAT repeat domain-containing protein [Planctomycetia bacterium]|nr:HEAT repeat domain-containing protein [Planctomycetia bacterium]
MKKKALLAALVVAAVLIGSVAASWGPLLGWLACHWQKEMETAGEDRAGVLLGRMASLGDMGIPSLVRTLGSSRPYVADSARRELDEKLRQWKSLHAQEASPHLARLADALAETVDHFGPKARSEAAELAEQILRCPLDPSAIDRAAVIAACEKVFRAAERDDDVPADRVPADTLADSERLLVDPTTIAELAYLPGGDLGPRAVPDASAMPGPLAGDDPATDSPAQPERFHHDERLQPLGGREPPGLLGESGAASKSAAVASRAAASSEASPNRRGAVVDARPSGDPKLPSDETIDLIRRLRDEDPASVAEAREALKRRGFTEVHLELGRQLFDPDPEARKQLVQVLPDLKSVDAEPWLLWLARDPDAGVRLAVITLMATGNDPVLLEQVERMARSDADSRVKRQAEQMARRRTETQR